MNENDEAFVDTIDTRRGADWFRSTLGGSKQIPCGEVQVIFETFEPDNHHFDIGVGSVGSGGFGQAAALSLGFFARSVASAYGPTLRRRAFKSLCKMPTDFMTFHFIVCDKQFHLNRLWCLNFKERRDDWHACIPVIAENTSSIIQIWRKRNESEGTGLLSSDGGGWWCGHYKSDLGESVSPIEHSGGAVVNATAVLGGAVIAFTGDVLIGCRKKKETNSYSLFRDDWFREVGLEQCLPSSVMSSMECLLDLCADGARPVQPGWFLTSTDHPRVCRNSIKWSSTEEDDICNHSVSFVTIQNSLPHTKHRKVIRGGIANLILWQNVWEWNGNRKTDQTVSCGRETFGP